MIRNDSAHWRSLVWVSPALVLLIIFVFYPIVANIVLSFQRIGTFPPSSRFIGLDNYVGLAEDPVFWTALSNNVAYAVVSVLFQVGLALVIAATLEELIGRRLQAWLRTLYVIPATISITVIGMLFKFLYDPRFGLVNEFLGSIGLSDLQRAWLGESETAMGSIIAMSQWQGIGFTALLFVVAIQRVPRELYDAAAIDGAGRVRSFFSITIPMIREMTAVLTILTVSQAFLVFNEVIVMTGGGPNNATQVLGTWLYQNAFILDDRGYGAAIATVVFVITLSFGIAQVLYTRSRRVEQ